MQIVSSDSCEMKVKGSRFIGEAHLVSTPDEVEDVLRSVQKREYAATHYCWAYRMSPDGSQFRINDDGEPSGTAGRPILRQIDSFGITNVIVVVTRYYGGTKLGKGGLVRAYGDSAKCALDNCAIEEKTIREKIRVTFAYDDTSLALHAIQDFDIIIERYDYHDQTELVLAVRKSVLQQFEHAFVDKLRGRAKVQPVT